MAKTAKNEARAGVTEILALLRHTFQPAQSVHFLIALVTLRWLADARRDARTLPCQLEIPSSLEYHIPLTLDKIALGKWFVAMFAQLEEQNPRELGGLFSGLNFSSPRLQGTAQDRGILSRAVEILWFQDRDQCSFELMKEALAIARSCLVTDLSAQELNTPAALCELAAQADAAKGARDRVRPGLRHRADADSHGGGT